MKVQWSHTKENKFTFPIWNGNFSNDLQDNFFVLNLDDFILIFVGLEALIYTIKENVKTHNLIYNTQVNLSNNSNSPISKSDQINNIINTTNNAPSKNMNIINNSFPELVYLNKKSLNFISSNEVITNVIKDHNNSNHFILSTDLGTIYIINYDEKDFYFEVVYSFEVKHHFIHEYKIMFFRCEEGVTNILMTLDKNLFLFEINISTVKNLLMIMTNNEEILFSFLKKGSYVVVFSNKGIHLIDLETDARIENILNKGSNTNFSCEGFVYKDVIYYVKDSNCFAIFDIYNRDNKFTVKLSAKTVLNDLNFFKILNVDDDMIVISNEKANCLYFINRKYKLIHRENIIFGNCRFVFNNEFILAVNLSMINSSMKYKVAVKEKLIDTTPVVVETYERGDNFPVCQLEDIEESYVNNKVKDMSLLSEIKTVKTKLRKTFAFTKQMYGHKVKINSYFADKDKFENFKFEVVHQINKLNILILKVKSYRGEEASFDINNILKFIHKCQNLILKIYIYNFGSRVLSLSGKINDLYFSHLYYEKLCKLINLSQQINDLDTYSKLIHLR